jgi:hypothetical protein
MKQWPDFNEHGDLPVGIHQATLAEVIEHFGRSSVQRRHVAERLARIYHLAHSTGHIARFIVYGSFITAKPNLNDVDIFLLMNDAFDKEQTTGEVRKLFEHLEAEHDIGASIFWIRRSSILDNERQMIEHWQLKRDLTKRGIVEVTVND